MTPERFKMLRVNKTVMTQTELGDFLGVSRQAVWAWEKGRAPIPRAVAIVLVGLAQEQPAFRD
jgi:DNA-binding XRE family transcriptional regulator